MPCKWTPPEVTIGCILVCQYSGWFHPQLLQSTESEERQVISYSMGGLGSGDNGRSADAGLTLACTREVAAPKELQTRL